MVKIVRQSAVELLEVKAVGAITRQIFRYLSEKSEKFKKDVCQGSFGLHCLRPNLVLSESSEEFHCILLRRRYNLG